MKRTYCRHACTRLPLISWKDQQQPSKDRYSCHHLLVFRSESVVDGYNDRFCFRAQRPTRCIYVRSVDMTYDKASTCMYNRDEYASRRVWRYECSAENGIVLGFERKRGHKESKARENSITKPRRRNQAEENRMRKGEVHRNSNRIKQTERKQKREETERKAKARRNQRNGE